MMSATAPSATCAFFRTLVLIALAAAGGCIQTATPPDVGPSSSDAGAPSFADTVISYSVGGQLTTCTNQLSPCGSPPGSDCAANPVLGPNDAMTFLLGPGDRLEVAFRCGVILNHAGATNLIPPDLKIWSMVPAGSSAVVEVGLSGDDFKSIDYLDSSDKTFSLSRIGVAAARFVRITNSGPGAIPIDAIEAL